MVRCLYPSPPKEIEWETGNNGMSNVPSLRVRVNTFPPPDTAVAQTHISPIGCRDGPNTRPLNVDATCANRSTFCESSHRVKSWRRPPDKIVRAPDGCFDSRWRTPTHHRPRGKSRIEYSPFSLTCTCRVVEIESSGGQYF